MMLRALIFLLFVSLTFVQCKQESGKMTTSSGYSFNKKHSTGGAKAKPGQFVYFEMDILDEKGEMLQSMRGAPQPQAAQIPEDGSLQAPNPIIDVLGAIAVGDTALLTIPMDSMPGANASIKHNKFILYDINLLEIVDKEEYDKRLSLKREEQAAAASAMQGRTADVAELVGNTLKQYKEKQLKDIVKMPSGLEYYIHEKGTGSMPEVGKKIKAHYYGVVKESGTMFDASFKKGRAFEFNLGVGAVIKGWDEGMAQLPRGSKATLFIPYDMAYGETGRPPSIPQKADLVFYVEILE